MPPLRQTLCLITLVNLGPLGSFPLDLSQAESKTQNWTQKSSKSCYCCYKHTGPGLRKSSRSVTYKSLSRTQFSQPPCISVTVLWL